MRCCLLLLLVHRYVCCFLYSRLLSYAAYYAMCAPAIWFVITWRGCRTEDECSAVEGQGLSLRLTSVTVIGMLGHSATLLQHLWLVRRLMRVCVAVHLSIWSTHSWTSVGYHCYHLSSFSGWPDLVDSGKL